MSQDIIREALRQVRYPGYSRDIVSFGLVKDIVLDGTSLLVRLEVQTRDAAIPEKIFRDCHEILKEVPGVEQVKVEIDVKEPTTQTAPTQAGASSIPGIKAIIAVGSGKGGVGKSTVSSNLAIALAAQGYRVGLCDCDLYGPSISLMFGVTEKPMADENDNIIPIEAHGIKLMSMGFLLDDSSPVIVRGPLATRYTQQFLRQVAWGELDYLILDLPPGTGDIQLTIVQTVALKGAVVVTTPQEVALIDARKAVSMFAKVNVPILGIIENMSWFECDSGKRYHLFGKEGGVREAARLGVPILAQIPIQQPIRECGDAGAPVALQNPQTNPASAAFHLAAKSLSQ